MGKVLMPGGGMGGSGSDECTAGKAQVLAGYKAITKDSDDEPAEGTIIDRGTSQTGGFGEGTDYYAINGLPVGYYRSDGSSWAPEARCPKATVRKYLGVDATIIRSGRSIAGVSGTLLYTSAINFSAAAISYDTIRISWTNPSKGPWTGVSIRVSTSAYPGTGGGSLAYEGNGWENQYIAGGSNHVDISGLSPETTYYFTCTSYSQYTTDGSTKLKDWGTSYNVSATTDPCAQNVFDTSTSSGNLWQYWCLKPTDNYAKYIYVSFNIQENKIYFTESTTTSMGDNMMSFAEGDGLNMAGIRYENVNLAKAEILKKYNATLYIDSTNERLAWWPTGSWDIVSRTYLKGAYTQIRLPGLNGHINDVGCGSGSSAKRFRLEFTK